MVHFVFQSIEFHVRGIHQATGRRLNYILDDSLHGVIEHFPGILISLTGLDPSLEQILIKAIAKCTQRNMLCKRKKIMFQ